MAGVARDLRHEEAFEEAEPTLTRFHERLLAEELTAQSGDSTPAAGQRALRSARRPQPAPGGGRGLRAGLAVARRLHAGGRGRAREDHRGGHRASRQLVAEGKSAHPHPRPATLRAQWQAELKEKFDLDVGRRRRPHACAPPATCFDQPLPVICSHPFAANRRGAARADPLGPGRHRRSAPAAQRAQARQQDRPGAAGRRCRTAPSSCSPPRRCRTTSSSCSG